MPLSEPSPEAAADDPDPFAGFWMGGYEGADHVNGAGQALDMNACTGHLARLDEDHRRAAQAGLRCVRESIGWRLAENAPGDIDLSRAVAVAQSARRHGLQVLWTLMHYGIPDDLCLHDDALIPRFAGFAAEAVRVLGPLGERPPVITPINEISFLAWAASMPDIFDAPNHTPSNDGEHSRISGYAVKRRLVRAALAGMRQIRAIEPRSRFLHVDPLLHVAAPHDRPDWAAQAAQVCDWQWQAWDLLSGRVEPDLGGSPSMLDLIGINHYHSSQWEHGSERRLQWHARDPRRRPLAALLGDVWRRYRRPLVVAETSHVGAGRAAWLAEMAGQVGHARRAGMPVQGLCLYPLTDRPDWADLARWHRSGLFHVDAGRNAGERAPAGRPLSRWPEAVYLKGLREWQRVLPQRDAGPAAATEGPASGEHLPCVMAFTHLRWEGIRHRTRHLLSRLAGRWRVVIVEEPRFDPGGVARLDCYADGPHTEILVPHTALRTGGFSAAQRHLLQALLQTWMRDRGIAGPLVWLATPMAGPLAHALAPSHMVYDCADELGSFLGAPEELPLREVELLAVANRVYAATEALAAARRVAARVPLRVLGNGVQARDYRVRRRPASGWDADEARALQAHLPAPRLGYMGVIDERMDLPLLAALADAHPGWHIVLVGPVTKIDPARLPRRSNLHWLGPQPYRLLPWLAAGWQLGLLPFLRSACTVRARPLKVLEYLAAGLPVVATDLPELRSLGPAGVVCVSGIGGFSSACGAALGEAPDRRALRRRAAQRVLRRHEWDDTVDALHRDLSGLLAEPAAGAALTHSGDAPCITRQPVGRNLPCMP